MIFDQAEYNVRCEWGEKGVTLLAPVSDVIIIVDILSFSTAVEVAANQGAVVFPYAWKDSTAYHFAASMQAEVADQGHPNKYSLSPSSLLNLPAQMRLVLPSPNGAALSLLTGSTPTIAGCLRNCRAVAESAMRRGQNISVIPAGERWKDGSLRPCFEDFGGAGAIIKYLRGTISPESKAALAAFENASENLFELMKACSSGKEKIERGEELDVKLAAEVDVSNCVPLFCDGAYVSEA